MVKVDVNTAGRVLDVPLLEAPDMKCDECGSIGPFMHKKTVDGVIQVQCMECDTHYQKDLNQ